MQDVTILDKEERWHERGVREAIWERVEHPELNKRGGLRFFLSHGWDKVRNGHIKRITDDDVKCLVLELLSTNVGHTMISCPNDPTNQQTLGIKLPFLVMTVKNLKKYFMFEIQVLDDKNARRRFQVSNYASTTRVKPFLCTLPMRLDGGWNHIHLNLTHFTQRAYGTTYVETERVQIHANCRIRRVYFCDRIYTEEELPADYKLYLPIQSLPSFGSHAAPAKI